MTTPLAPYDQDNPYAKARGLVQPSVVGPSSYDDDNPYAKARGLLQNQFSIQDQVRQSSLSEEESSLSEEEIKENRKFAWDRYGTKTKVALGVGQVAGVYGGATHLSKGYNIGKEIIQKGRGAYTNTGWEAATNAVKGAKGFKATAGALSKFAPALDVAFAAHGAYDDINNPEGRGAAYGGGFWNGLGGSLEGAANGLTAGGYDAVRSFNWGKPNKYSKIGTVNPDPFGSGKLAEKYAQKFFDWYNGNSKPAPMPQTLTEQL